MSVVKIRLKKQSLQIATDSSSLQTSDSQVMSRIYNAGAYYGAVFTAVLAVLMTDAVVRANNYSSELMKTITPTPATTALKYVATSSIIMMAPKVTCQENYMLIELDRNMYSHLNLSSFHLGDSSCFGKVTGTTIKLKSALNRCNTASTQTDDAITYKNEVRAEIIKDNNGNKTITRKDVFVLPFNCTYKRRKNVGVSFKPKHRVDGGEGAFGNFTFLMDLYSNKDYNQEYNTSDYPISVQLNDRLYIKYQVLSDEGDLYVFAEKCLATTTGSESTQPSYVFLDKGCVMDDTMEYNYIRNREQYFSIKAFRFIADYPVVYLHCLLMVCHSSYNDSKCAVGCKTRVRRDTSRDERRQESNLYHLSSGPIILKKNTKSSPGSTAPQSATVIALSSTVGLLLVGCFVLAVLLRHKNRQNTKKQSSIEQTQMRAYANEGVNREDAPVNPSASDHTEGNVGGDGSQ